MKTEDNKFYCDKCDREILMEDEDYYSFRFGIQCINCKNK